MNLLLSPPIVFSLFMLVGLGIYALGKTIAPPFKKTPLKEEAYACGEDVQNQRAPFSYQDFFRIALFYTIMEVGALIIATIPSTSDALWSLVYLFVISISVATLTMNYD
jgi:NADH-quinone oxidoreductase subunit A